MTVRGFRGEVVSNLHYSRRILGAPWVAQGAKHGGLQLVLIWQPKSHIQEAVELLVVVRTDCGVGGDELLHQTQSRRRNSAQVLCHVCLPSRELTPRRQGQ